LEDKLVEKWVQKAFSKNKGKLHRALGVAAGKKIPAGKLAKATSKGGKLGKEARLAQTAKKFHHGGDKTKSNVAG
jgi:hypothetical protein